MANYGFGSSRDGIVVDQAQLLNDIRMGLAEYNREPDELIARLSQLVTVEKIEAAQAPGEFGDHVEGSRPALQKDIYRKLLFPLNTYDRSTGWTRIGLQDARPEKITMEADSAVRGDALRVNKAMAQAIFTKRTAGSVSSDTGYFAGFWNGETDVPNNGQNSFDGVAHYHYKGLNTTTFSRSQIDAAIEDIVEHGYSGPFVALFSIAQMTDVQGVIESTSITTSAGRSAVNDRGVHQGFEWGGVTYLFKNWVPAGYFAVISTDVEALGRREHANEAFRGLQVLGPYENTTEPLVDTVWTRRIGFSVLHQGAGTVRQLVASTSYTNPTFL